MKEPNCTGKNFVVKESRPVRNASARIKQMLDAEYKKNNLKSIIINLNYIKDIHKNSLLELLQKYEEMFDGTLAKYTCSDYTIGLKEDAKPYRVKPFPILTIHKPTLKKEGNRLIKIGILKKINNS